MSSDSKSPSIDDVKPADSSQRVIDHTWTTNSFSSGFSSLQKKWFWFKKKIIFTEIEIKNNLSPEVCFDIIISDSTIKDSCVLLNIRWFTVFTVAFKNIPTKLQAIRTRPSSGVQMYCLSRHLVHHREAKDK